MHRLLICCACSIVLQPLLSAPTLAQSEPGGWRVLIQTQLGDIEVEVDTARASVTAANFLKYVNGKYYHGGSCHRTVKPDNQSNNKVKIEVIQASINSAREKDSFPPIKLERTNQTGLTHKDGTISMARDGPDTATSDFFICIGDQPSLDYGGARNPDGQGFAAFGSRQRHGRGEEDSTRSSRRAETHATD